MEQKFCTECGAQINAKAVICPACGVRQAQPTSELEINNYLVPSILVTLFCCLPLGLVSIVYASQVNTKLAAGDTTGARQASESARKWLWAAVILGVVVGVLYLLLIIASEM